MGKKNYKFKIWIAYDIFVDVIIKYVGFYYYYSNSIFSVNLLGLLVI